MSARSLLILVLVTAVILVIALSWRGERDTDGLGPQPAVPGLRDRVNDIDRVELRGAGDALLVSLVRDRARWQVTEFHGYEADFDRVHDLLRGLAEARRLEQRTDNPQWYRRLGVEDIAEPDAEGVMVAFPGHDLPAVILGNAAPDFGGQYLREADQARSWLIDRGLDVPRTALEWLERSVMDIPASEIDEVVIVHPDGDRVRLKRLDLDLDQLVLLDVPEGYDARPWHRLRPVANGLAGVRLESVRPHQAVPEDAVRALFTTIDRLNFVVSAFDDDDGRWLHFSVSAETTAREDEELEEDEIASTVDAAAVDARLSPWQFRVPSAKFEALTRRMEDLIEEVDSES